MDTSIVYLSFRYGVLKWKIFASFINIRYKLDIKNLNCISKSLLSEAVCLIDPGK